MGHESARPGLGPRQRQGPQRPARAARRAAAAAVTVTSHRHPAAVTPVIYYARSVPDTQAGIMSHHVTACQWASGPARAGGSRGSHHRVTLAVPVTGGIMSHAHPAAVTVSAGLGVTVTQSVAALCLPGCLGQWSESDIMCRRRRTGTDSESHKSSLPVRLSVRVTGRLAADRQLTGTPGPGWPHCDTQAESQWPGRPAGVPLTVTVAEPPGLSASGTVTAARASGALAA